MTLEIGSQPDAVSALGRLNDVLADVSPRIVACSGGVDSLVLATVAHRADPASTTVAHTVTPAVPGDGTSRVLRHAERGGWRLEIVRSGEFDDERYLANPTDRCYHCKRNLYDAIGELRGLVAGGVDDHVADSSIGALAERVVIVSGANLDDLGEYRPGLDAAAERAVRHPFVEAGIGKYEVRAVARHLGLVEADLPASPCLASRLYTGTRVTPSRLRAVEAGEEMVRSLTGISVVRCRVIGAEATGDVVRVEVGHDDRALLDTQVIAEVERTMRAVEPGIERVVIDDEPYRPGRAVRFGS